MNVWWVLGIGVAIYVTGYVISLVFYAKKGHPDWRSIELAAAWPFALYWGICLFISGIVVRTSRKICALAAPKRG